MKFYTNQLPQLLTQIASGKVKSLLLYGYNRGFISAVVNQLVKKFDLLSTSVTTKEATASNLNLLANSTNFFKQKELLKVDYTGSGLNKELKEFLADGDFTNFICFVGEESLPASGIRKFFEDSKDYAVMPCYYDDENTIGRIAVSVAARSQKTFSQDALFYLKEKLKGDHQIIKNELDKLINYAHDKQQIAYDDVKASLSADLSASGDEMCIYFSKKQPELFLTEIEKLRSQNINEILMIRALIRYYINLFIVTSKIEDGQSIDNAVRALAPPIFFKYVSDFKQVAAKMSSKDIIKIIDLLQQAEVKFKTNNKNFDFFGEVYLPAYKE